MAKQQDKQNLMVRTDFCPIIDAGLIVLLSILYHILSPNQLYLLVVERHLPPSPSQLVNKKQTTKVDSST